MIPEYETPSMNRSERRAAGKKAGITSASSRASTPHSLHDAGRQHLRAGQLAEAEKCCRQALAMDGGHADSLYLTALISIEHRQFDQAIEWIARAIKLEPKVEFLSTLGTTLRFLGRLDEALKVFDKAISLSPEDAELWKDLGTVLMDLQRGDEAVLSLQQALKLDPRNVDAANILGLLHFRQGRFQEALECFSLSIDVRPKQADALHMRAIVLERLKRFDEALSDNIRSHELDPTNPETSNNLGHVLRLLGRLDESLEWFDRALSLRPDFVEALGNKAFALTQFRRFDEAFACYEKSRSIDPNDALTEWNQAMLQMLTGNFEAGWAGRESRWRTGLGMADPKFPQPLWLGDSPLEGRTILLYADEGLGDCIQFARYVPMVAARGARVILAVADPACPLLSGLPGVSRCLPKSASLPEFDLHCPMSSLPLAFRTTLDSIPAAKSYLPRPANALVQEWESRLGPRDGLRVGLVWAGNPSHANDHNRSIGLENFSRILDVDATFFSLQKDLRAGDKAMLAGYPEIVDLTQHLSDFVQTAAMVSCLDLVISVDTSVAHLAGALGCPVWILLPYTPDYRWLLDRDDSPWYPTVRLFRQSETRDYASVLERVRAELLRLQRT
jgi:tetratricopeptide (TPR) repeat protein